MSTEGHHNQAPDAPAGRLDEAMTRRGLQLRKRWVQIADEAGITTSALGGIRRGEFRPSAHTAQALEQALEWLPGSIARILDGGDPVAAQKADEGDRPADAEQIARAFHEAYEKLAPQYGYKTRRASAVPWADVPESNRSLMIATVSALLDEGVFAASAALRRAEAAIDRVRRAIDTERAGALESEAMDGPRPIHDAQLNTCQHIEDALTEPAEVGIRASS